MGQVWGAAALFLAGVAAGLLCGRWIFRAPAAPELPQEAAANESLGRPGHPRWAQHAIVLKPGEDQARPTRRQ